MPTARYANAIDLSGNYFKRSHILDKEQYVRTSRGRVYSFAIL
ncbi:hypothetical protein COO91_02215 [Nostoc flagelliforme CCNUN1]|uniref:Uncharacterized protein n=1 Tax=Nostoc flagelliforme CCNUN1 TaxID=2038116 RepID=A0A2K8SLK0_9NOSO|nr:hypothetical protein [Nostoc flagelliforme]AUB36309.1 hypothetical protein COO91_02215 [Nostoc flagelliforme CCNUN1]